MTYQSLVVGASGSKMKTGREIGGNSNTERMSSPRGACLHYPRPMRFHSSWGLWLQAPPPYSWKSLDQAPRPQFCPSISPGDSQGYTELTPAGHACLGLQDEGIPHLLAPHAKSPGFRLQWRDSDPLPCRPCHLWGEAPSVAWEPSLEGLSSPAL